MVERAKDRVDGKLIKTCTGGKFYPVARVIFKCRFEDERIFQISWNIERELYDQAGEEQDYAFSQVPIRVQTWNQRSVALEIYCEIRHPRDQLF